MQAHDNDFANSVTNGVLLAAASTADESSVARKSVLLIGSCSLHEVIAPLRSRMDASQRWRRPTIALMSPPLPASTIGLVNASPDVESYILDDLRKSHIAEIRSRDSDVLVFELLRDIFTGVVRLGDSWIANPCELFGFPGSAPIFPVEGGPGATLGLEIAPDALSFRDDDFLDVWRVAFGQFRDQVILPRLRQGGRVILFETTLTKRSFGFAVPWVPDDGYADRANAVLAAMTGEVRRVPGIEVLTIPEALRVTAPDVYWGGPFYTHYIAEAYAFASDQLAAMLLGPTARGDASIAASLCRAQAQLDSTLQLTAAAAERDAAQAETMILKADLAAARAALDKAEAARRQQDDTLASMLAEREASHAERAVLQADLAAARHARAEDEAVRLQVAAALAAMVFERDVSLALRVQLDRATVALSATELTMSNVARSLLHFTEKRVAAHGPTERGLFAKLRDGLLGRGAIPRRAGV
jgi:hypothetical protein